MPDPPTVGLFTQYILENPWPASLALLGMAAALTWLGLREGLANRLKLAAVFAVVGGAILATGLIVTTPAEHGRSVTRQFVDAVGEQRITQAEAMLAGDAMLGLESPTSPGYSRDVLVGAIRRLDGRYTLDWHQITTLDAYTQRDDRAEVHLTVLAQPSGTRAVRSRWVIHVSEQPDGRWLIDRITCISINDRTPRAGWFR